MIFPNRNWQLFTGLNGDAIGLGDWLTAIHPEDADRLRAIGVRPMGAARICIWTRFAFAGPSINRTAGIAVPSSRFERGPESCKAGSARSLTSRIKKTQAGSLEQAVLLRTQELRRANSSLQEEVVERMRAEDRVRGVATELRRSNEELEKFAYVASHDLQEPLRKILAFGDRLNRKSRDRLDEQGQGYLERMLAAAARMRTLIDDLLTFSRVATDLRPFVSVDLEATLAGVVADLEASLAQSQGRVDAGSLPTIQADAMQMRQLVQNLVGNALKFAKPGEPPVVSIDRRSGGECARPTADPPPPGFAGWRLTFADRGIGFDQVHERRIFEVFQRLHGRDQYDGTGIGLAICRKSSNVTAARFTPAGSWAWARLSPSTCPTIRRRPSLFRREVNRIIEARSKVRSRSDAQ